jgi:hypothetical protein
VRATWNPTEEPPARDAGHRVPSDLARTWRSLPDERNGHVRSVVVGECCRGAALPPPCLPEPLADERLDVSHQLWERANVGSHLLRGRRHGIDDGLQGRTERSGPAQAGDRPPHDHDGEPESGGSTRCARGDGRAPRCARRSLLPLPASGGRASQCHHQGRRHDERECDQGQRQHGEPTPDAAAGVPAPGRPQQRADDPANGTGQQGHRLRRTEPLWSDRTAGPTQTPAQVVDTHRRSSGCGRAAAPARGLDDHAGTGHTARSPHRRRAKQMRQTIVVHQAWRAGRARGESQGPARRQHGAHGTAPQKMSKTYACCRPRPRAPTVEVRWRRRT